MKYLVIAALLSIPSTEALAAQDDWLVETPSVGEFLDAQADMNVLGAERSDMMAAIPKDHQITYTQAKSTLGNLKGRNVDNGSTYNQVSESERETQEELKKEREKVKEVEAELARVKKSKLTQKSKTGLVQTKSKTKSKASHKVSHKSKSQVKAKVEEKLEEKTEAEEKETSEEKEKAETDSQEKNEHKEEQKKEPADDEETEEKGTIYRKLKVGQWF